MKTIFNIVVALAIPLSLCGCQPKSAQAPAVTKVEQEIQGPTLTVALQDWPKVAKVQGSLFADEVTTIAAKVPGRVVEVNCDLGDLVQANQTLVKLDQLEYELLAAQAESQLTQARAAIGLKPGDPVEKLNPLNAPPVREAAAVLDEAKKSVERLRKLFQQGAVVATDIEAATALESVADARFNSSLNSVREKIALVGVQTALRALAEQRLKDTIITAPFKGRVQNRLVAVGSYVNVGQSILEIARTEVLRYRATVPERYASQIALGQKVVLNLSDQTPREVRITRISPTLDSVSRSLMFEAEVPNAQDELRSGSFAQADVILDDKAKSVVVPASALVRFAGVQKVWKVVDGQVREAVVEIGDEQDGQVRIERGLNEGDILLADGNGGGAGKYVSDSPSTTNQPTTSKAESPDAPPAEAAKSEMAPRELKKSEASNGPTPVSASTSNNSSQSALGR